MYGLKAVPFKPYPQRLKPLFLLSDFNLSFPALLLA